MTAAPLPDARPGNWVDRYAPKTVRPWLKLARFDRPIGTWLLLLPGWQAIAMAGAQDGKWPDLKLLVLFAIGSLVMRGAGCAYNDIVDRDYDAKVARTALRPIPAGEISVKGAWAYLVGLSLIGFLILVTLKPLAIALGFGSLLLVAIYPFMKRITWWPQAWLGLTFNWGAPLGYAAATGHFAWPAALLYASGICWTLGYDTIYAVQDMEDDALVGVKSSALRLGAGAPKAVAIFYALCVLLAAGASATAHLGPLVVPFLTAYGIHLFWQTRHLRVDDGAQALRLFKSNRDAGLILFVGLMAGALQHGGLFGLYR